MRKVLLLILSFLMLVCVQAQKRFNVTAGQGFLKLMPATLKGKSIRSGRDRVKDAKGFLGVVVHRDYGDAKQGVRIELINLSPSLTAVNKVISNPAGLDPNKYMITTIGGYKALIQTLIKETGAVDYELLLPMSATLLYIRTTGFTRTDLIAIATALPIVKIATAVAK